MSMRVLRRARRLQGYTVRSFVGLLAFKGFHITASTLYNWETGRTIPPADAFMAACILLRVQPHEVFADRKGAPADDQAPVPEFGIDPTTLAEHDRCLIPGAQLLNLRNLRKRHKLKVDGVADILANAGCKVSVSSVYNWEKGTHTPAPMIQRALAKIFNCQLEELVHMPAEDREPAAQPAEKEPPTSDGTPNMPDIPDTPEPVPAEIPGVKQHTTDRVPCVHCGAYDQELGSQCDQCGGLI